MNKIFLFGLLINAFAHATGTMCTVKRDASYAGFSQCSNDMHAYKMFSYGTCASSVQCDISAAVDRFVIFVTVEFFSVCKVFCSPLKSSKIV